MLKHTICRLEYAWADFRLHLAWRALQLALQHKYRPDQPRAPRGSPIGGQWIAVGSSERRRETELIFAQALEGITKHAINQIINRGVSPAAILDALSNPIVVRPRLNMTTQYIGARATVVLNGYGGIVTVWGR